MENADKSNAPVWKIKDHTNDVTSVDFSGRSLLATGSSDKKVRIYKWQEGDKFEEVNHSPLIGHQYAVNCIAFSPFGTKLASSSTDGFTFIWNVKTGERICTLKQSDVAVRTCAYSSNTALLATGGDDDMATLWDMSRNVLLRQFRGHESTVTCVAFTPDSNFMASGCTVGEVRMWDARYGHSTALTVRQDVHDLGVTCMQFNPAIGKEENTLLGKYYLLATGGQDTDLNLWIVGVSQGFMNNKGSYATVRKQQTLCGHTAPIMSLRFSTSGLLLASTSGDKTVRLWDPLKFCPLGVLASHTRYVTCCTFSEDGKLLASGSGDRTVMVWNIPFSMDRSCSSSSKIMTAFQKTISPVYIRENKKLSEWTNNDVCSWLTEQGLAEYAHNFRVNAIDGKEFLSLNDTILEEKLGVGRFVLINEYIHTASNEFPFLDAVGHRSKILRLINKFAKKASEKIIDGNAPPSEFLCPITHELIKDPVLCADGFTYERVAIAAWLASGKRTSPMTNEKLIHFTLTPNRTLHALIQWYKEESL